MPPRAQVDAWQEVPRNSWSQLKFGTGYRKQLPRRLPRPGAMRGTWFPIICSQCRSAFMMALSLQKLWNCGHIAMAHCKTRSALSRFYLIPFAILHVLDVLRDASRHWTVRGSSMRLPLPHSPHCGSCAGGLLSFCGNMNSWQKPSNRLMVDQSYIARPFAIRSLAACYSQMPYQSYGHRQTPPLSRHQAVSRSEKLSFESARLRVWC